MIVGSDVGCLTAMGSQTSTSTKINYQIRFPLESGRVHSGEVERPCGVIPPDFGRGRGSIWIEYDRSDPDRIRVLNDHRAETVRGITLAAVPIWAAGVVLWWVRTSRRRRSRVAR